MWGDAAEVGPHAGTGADLFVIKEAVSVEDIVDFQPGKDRIELDGEGISNFQDLTGHMQMTQEGVVISLPSHGQLVLHGIAVNQLSPQDFIFSG